jgi:hypothetical protein
VKALTAVQAFSPREEIVKRKAAHFSVSDEMLKQCAGLLKNRAAQVLGMKIATVARAEKFDLAVDCVLKYQVSSWDARTKEMGRWPERPSPHD